MKEIQQYLRQLEEVFEKHDEYKAEAYNFVMSGLHYAVEKLNEHRHLTGQELCWGIRDYALEQFGSLTRTVFKYWGISETYDFGKIVYYLIDTGLMTKTDEDSLEDFRNVYAFEDVFNKEVEYDI